MYRFLFLYQISILIYISFKKIIILQTYIKNRNINDIPHPFIKESLKKFSLLEEIDRKKVYFTHLNHTNNVLQPESTERSDVIKKGFQIAQESMVFTI